MLVNFILYIMGHCLAGTSLQTDRMAIGKSKHNAIDITKVPTGQKPMKLWWHWLTHHAMVNGLAVILITYFITNNKELAINLGLIEVFAHWIIDYFKCDNKYNPNIDQILHLTCKFIYVIIIELMEVSKWIMNLSL